mmetsp:Transcript_14794/g.20672  ORF Transcript_14794/g.20672 Transcript_14794/m.20672 type:complete len:481 (+) Transcript_14794:3-1445(+)
MSRLLFGGGGCLAFFAIVFQLSGGFQPVSAQYSPSAGSNLTQSQFDFLRWCAWESSNCTNNFEGINEEQHHHLLKFAIEFQENMEQYNLRYNQSLDIVFQDSDRKVIIEYEDVGDSTCWTGHYIAALAHQYNNTAPSSDSADLTLALMIQILETALINVQCTGTDGYIPRFNGLGTDPAYLAYLGDSSHSYPSVLPNSSFLWLGQESRDQYMGMAFGLSSVLQFVNNERAQNLATKISEIVLDKLIQDDFWIVSPAKGELPVNPIPIFSAMWMRIGLRINASKYQNLQSHYDRNFDEAEKSGQMTISSRFGNAYYANNLCVLAVYSLFMMEDTNMHKRGTLLKHLETTATVFEGSEKGGGLSHLQATFEAYYASAYLIYYSEPLPSDSAAVGVLLGTLLDFPPPPNWDIKVDLTQNPEYYPHYSDSMSEYAIMVADRPRDEFVWQRAPVQLTGGSSSSWRQYSSSDFLLPYWVARVASVL